MVGVPRLVWWVVGPSSRTSWPRPSRVKARIATLVDRDGSVRIINSFFKTALDGSAIDNFRFGATELPDEAKARLDALVNQLKASPQGVFIEIEGHTDSVGPTTVNEQIGLPIRADAAQSLRARVIYALNSYSGEVFPDPLVCESEAAAKTTSAPAGRKAACSSNSPSPRSGGCG